MRNPIKVIIKKLRPLGYDWVKYEEAERILIDGLPPITTEAQLCYYIYKRHGEGRYQLLAWQRGYEGFWMFWLGDITSHGFIRDKSKSKVIDKLKQEHRKAQSYDEKYQIEEQIQLEKDMREVEKNIKRRGPMGIEKSPVGQLNQYQEF